MKPPGKLSVSPCGRLLIDEAGAPFFYLADTAWTLPQRLDLEEARHYLDARAAQGFNAIQIVALGELEEGNRAGEPALLDRDPDRPNEAYWKWIDAIVALCAERGLLVGFLPTWGDRWHGTPTGRPAIFDPENARRYGRWLGRRYRDASLIWILGGDRSVDTDFQLRTIRAMAEGLAEGDGGVHLRGFHPRGSFTSADYVHGEAWLDFHMAQSGHTLPSLDNYRLLARDYGLVPVRPILDGEPCYEETPWMNGDWTIHSSGNFYGAHEVRRAAWWAFFSGVFGHVYGAHPVWCMHDEGRYPILIQRHTWKTALQLPGAGQMRHLPAFASALPTIQRVPRPDLVEEAPAGRLERCLALSSPPAADGARRWMAVYLPGPCSATVRVPEGFAGRAVWFDTSSGGEVDAGRVCSCGLIRLQTPSGLEDAIWLLRAAG